MFRQFDDPDDLIRDVAAEAGSRTRHPVRFILVSGLDAWRIVLERLTAVVDSVVRLSSRCSGDDTFPYLGRITDLLAGVREERTLLVPLAEPLRLRREFGYMVRMLALWEMVSRRRVYIPLFELTELVLKELVCAPRYADGELPPVWAIGGSGGVMLRVLPFQVALGDAEAVNGIKEYLDIWETGGRSRLYLVTRWASEVCESAGNFRVVVYRDAFDILAKQVSDWPATFSRGLGQDQEWEWLARQSLEGDTFSALCARVLNVKHWDQNQLLLLWGGMRRSHRWLIWLWSKLAAPKETYLHRVAETSSDAGRFEEDLVNGVFDVWSDRKLLEERKAILETMRVRELPSSFWGRLSELTDPLAKLACLAGITEREKEEAVRALKELIERGVPDAVWGSYLEIAFPQLVSYLGSMPLDDPVAEEYFRLYNRSRLRDEAEPALTSKASVLGRGRVVWSYEPRDSLLERMAVPGAKVIWVDGMGVEWLSLIRELLLQYEDIVVEVQVGRANLPTLTDYNAGWTEGCGIDRGIDEIAHSYTYSFPGSFVMQMAVIERVVKKAFGALSGSPMVIITSDHGLTRFAGTMGKVPLPRGAEIGKWGRYAMVPENGEPPAPGTNCVVDGRFALLTTHERFVGAPGASGEVHGGATLEECLVPVIRVTKRAQPGVTRGVVVLTQKVKLDVRGEGQLVVRVLGPCTHVWLRVFHRQFVGRPVSEDTWKFTLRDLAPGRYRGTVDWEGGHAGQVEFEVTRGLAERDLGV